MADAGSLFDLAAKISVDASQSDKALTDTQKKVLRLADDFKRLDKSVAGSKTHIAQLGSQSSATAASLGSMNTALPLIAGGAIAAASAIAAAAAGIYKLATFSTHLGAEIFDLSQKVNFSAETLSSLKIAAELSGGSLASLSTSLGIFDRNIEEAASGGEEMSRVFKILKIDTADNEKALRQVFTALGDMTSGSLQTATAMKLFGRSGKEVLGVIKEAGGDVDKYTEKLREMGLVITKDGAQRADKFGDELTMLRNKLEAVARQIGQELVPTVSKAADDISRWLKENQGEIIRTAKEVGTLVAEFYRLAKAVASPFIAQIVITRKFVDLVQGSSAKDVGASQTNIFGANPAYGRVPPPLPSGLPTLSVFRTQSLGTFSSPFRMSAEEQAAERARKAQEALERQLRGGGGGGKGSGGGAQKDILEGLKNTLTGLNAEYRKFNEQLLGSATLSALAAEKEKLLADVMRSLNTSTKMKVAGLKDVDEALEAAIGALPKKSQEAARALVEQALAQFKSNEQTRISGEITKQADDLMKQWKQDIENTRAGADEYTLAIQRLEQAYRDYGGAMDEGTRAELEALATKLRLLKVERERLSVLSQTRARVVGGNILRDLGEGSVVFREEASRPRIATVDRQVLQEQIEIFNDRMRVIAADLTNTIDNALRVGFESGMKAGLLTFVQGILQMIQSAALQALERKIFEILSGLGSNGGGGGLLGKFAGIAIGAALGGLGGGGSWAKFGANFPAIGRATGGPIWPGNLYKVHQGEMIVPSRLGMVLNQEQQAMMGGVTINVYARDAQSFQSRDTQSQILRQITRLQQRRMLTG